MWPLRSRRGRSDGLSGNEWALGPLTRFEPLRWVFFWGALLGTIGLFDLWRASKHDGSTLSEVTRLVLATETPQGRATFELGLTVLHRHILK